MITMDWLPTLLATAVWNRTMVPLDPESYSLGFTAQNWPIILA